MEDEMTQNEFAKMMDFSDTMWWQVLDGRRNLRWRNAKKVANELGGDPNLWREGGSSKERRKVWKEYAEENS
jgi:hypothetical protein